jgi:hypothetical protein
MDITPFNHIVIFLPVITLQSLRRMRLSALAVLFGHADFCHDVSCRGLSHAAKASPSDRPQYPLRDSFGPNGINGLSAFRMGNRVDFNLRRFEQKALGSKQHAESVGLDVIVKIFAGCPLLDQTENVLVFDAAENLAALTPSLIFRRINQ